MSPCEDHLRCVCVHVHVCIEGNDVLSIFPFGCPWHPEQREEQGEAQAMDIWMRPQAWCAEPAFYVSRDRLPVVWCTPWAVNPICLPSLPLVGLLHCGRRNCDFLVALLQNSKKLDNLSPAASWAPGLCPPRTPRFPLLWFSVWRNLVLVLWADVPEGTCMFREGLALRPLAVKGQHKAG